MLAWRQEVVMADTVRRVEYCYVTVPDKPGEGRRVLKALKENGVNLLAYLGFPNDKAARALSA